MKIFSRVAQPISWILFTYSACRINLRSDDNTALYETLALFVVAAFFTWRSYRK